MSSTASSEARFAQDRETLLAMADIYCRAHHGTQGELCSKCASVIEYAVARTEKCPFNHETNCKDCYIHCYNGEMRDEVRAVMGYAGPRMLLRHPVMTMRYLRKKLAKR